MGILVTAATIVLLSAFTFVFYSAVCLLTNYLVARRIGVPVRIILVDHINPLWMLISQPVASILRRLPFGLGNNNITNYNYLGWEYRMRWKAHSEMGDLFILCSPTRLWLYLGSPELISAVLRRPTDFPHDSEFAAMMDCFGPNIATVHILFLISNMSCVYADIYATARFKAGNGRKFASWSARVSMIQATTSSGERLSLKLKTWASIGVLGRLLTQLHKISARSSSMSYHQLGLESSIGFRDIENPKSNQDWKPRILTKMRCKPFSSTVL